jgi:hypothetical protein
MNIHLVEEALLNPSWEKQTQMRKRKSSVFHQQDRREMEINGVQF